VNSASITALANAYIAQFAQFEIEGDVLANLREYALANSLFWALAEGHACEQSARRNAMDVSYSLSSSTYPLDYSTDYLFY